MVFIVFLITFADETFKCEKLIKCITIKYFRTMIHTHVIGRVGKDAEVKNGKKGDFMSMDIAVDNFVKGEQATTWVRVGK